MRSNLLDSGKQSLLAAGNFRKSECGNKTIQRGSKSHSVYNTIVLNIAFTEISIVNSRCVDTLNLKHIFRIFA